MSIHDYMLLEGRAWVKVLHHAARRGRADLRSAASDYRQGGEDMRLAEVAFVRIGTTNVAAHAAFAGELLGLRPVPGSDDEAWFRSDIRRRTLVFDPSGPSSVGIALHDPRDLDAIAERLDEAGHAYQRHDRAACDRLFIRGGLRVADPSGNLIDLVYGPHQSGIRFFPQRDNGIQGLEGVALRSTSPERDLPFWRDLLGFELRDRVGEITYIGTDELHHRIALYPSDRPGVLYINFAVEDLELVMQNKYFMQSRQVRLPFGPGRQAASNQIFLMVEGPDGLLYNLVTETRKIDPSRHRPRQFASDAHSLCSWGSRPEGIAELVI